MDVFISFFAFPAEYKLLLANDARFKVMDCGVRYVEHHVVHGYEGSGDKVYGRYCTLEYLGSSALWEINRKIFGLF